MNSNFALRTLMLLAAWLVFQNFNLPKTTESKRVGAECRTSLRDKSMESPSVVENLSATTFIPHLLPSTLCHPPSAYQIRKVVLDAGHGGKDPGCKGATSKEKDNALAIVLKLGEMIKGAFPDVEVIYTRQTDEFIELKERAAIANRNKADLFISVHCNAIKVSRVKGTETYVMGLHTADHNLEVAKRENASIYLEDDYEKNYEGYDPNSPEAHIIGSVWQSAYLEQSILFASFVQQFAKSTAYRDDKGVKQAGFLLLRETAMPAVLVETGYLTNRSEEYFIASEEGQAQMAQAIFEAFEAYKIKVEGNTVAQQKTNKNTNAASKPQSPPAQPKTSGSMVVNTPPKSTQTSKTVEKQVVETTPAKSAKPKPAASSPTSQRDKPASVASATGPFRIFLLSWPMRMDRNSGQLGLIGDVKEEKIEGQYHYFTGDYPTRAEAEKTLPEIKNLGFRTATIVQAK